MEKTRDEIKVERCTYANDKGKEVDRGDEMALSQFAGEGGTRPIYSGVRRRRVKRIG